MSIDDLLPLPEPAPGDPGQPGADAPSVSADRPPTCPTRTRWYRNGALAKEGFPAEDLSERLEEDPASFVWLDLYDPDIEDLAIVTQEFGLHPLAIEDAVHDRQRPKLDRYASHLFLNVYAVDAEDDGLRTSEVSAFVLERALITVRKADFDIDALVARWDSAGWVTSAGVGGLLHGLLDAIVDGQARAVDRVGDAVEGLEDALFDDDSRLDIRRRGFEVRKDLATLRRVTLPMRDVVGRLLHAEEGHLVPDRLQPYYQDVYDHVLHIGDDVESDRDLVANVLETSLNQQSNELNEVTKKLAAWAAIIAVPTAITGFYGQNVPYPGFAHEWGFITSTVLIVLLAGGLYLLLKRRGWL
ncbi:magnesium transporter CorA family protein [Amnibacterium sp. CER49]|uniref:magnesium transporter CorA family protein n=1 Tax=Amnibacterium sp. CER49 TaxID=3039161 RepID=UPI00244C5BCB|nr:magnesium transporter CorA family protein [Amnibacterium sp. CER49]MDH2442653.1 magnesium transporter CorA family protein [Amnibacterium sp. CER49]